MSDLDQSFEAAAAASSSLPASTSNDSKLALYGLFKQAKSGDAAGKRPGFTDPVGRAKYDAWAKNKGMPIDQAKQAYVDMVTSLGN